MKLKTHSGTVRYAAALMLAIPLLVASGCSHLANYVARRAFIDAHHERKVSSFDLTPIQPGDVVFLGDSLTEGGSWSELFPGVPVRNRGIIGDTTAGVLTRIGQIADGKPSRVFILIGTNDLGTGVSDDEIIANYDAIVDAIRHASPATKLYIESLLPRERGFRKDVTRLNARLAAFAHDHGLVFIDLYPLFVDDYGALRADLTNDGLHLLGEGYRIWAIALKRYIAL